MHKHISNQLVMSFIFFGIFTVNLIFYFAWPQELLFFSNAIQHNDFIGLCLETCHPSPATSGFIFWWAVGLDFATPADPVLASALAATFLFKILTVSFKDIGGHLKSKLQTEQKLHFQLVHFCSAHSAHFGIVRIVVTPETYKANQKD